MIFLSLSAVIITKNEEEKIAGCIKSVSWADEIILVDSFSCDDTVHIAESLGAKVFLKEFIDYSSSKNFGISKAKSEWVLSIDADEVVSDDLKKEILEAINSPRSGSDAFVISRKSFVGNRPFYISRHVRLFKKTKGFFAGKVHEAVKVEGKTGSLSAPLLHFTYSSWRECFKKNNFYTEINAIELSKKDYLFILQKMLFELIMLSYDKFREIITEKKIPRNFDAAYFCFVVIYFGLLKNFKALKFKFFNKTENRVCCTYCGSIDSKIFYEFGKRRLKGVRFDRTSIAKCSRCGLVFSFPQPSLQKLRSFYGSEEYDYYSGRVELFSKIALYYINELNKIFPKKGKLLDFGCGIGIFFFNAKKEGWKVTCVDSSRLMAGKAKKKFNLKVYPSLDELPKQKFDVVFMQSVFEHIQEPSVLLKKLRNFMHKNSIIVIDVPNFNSIFRLFKGKDWYLLSPQEHLFHFDSKSISMVLNDAGFRVKSIKFPTVYDYGIIRKNPFKGFLHSIISFFGLTETIFCVCELKERQKNEDRVSG
ncbi:MAG: methyltransferase domain-containing protein [Candidatus Diapherotrites archaeon]